MPTTKNHICPLKLLALIAASGKVGAMKDILNTVKTIDLLLTFNINRGAWCR